MASDPADKLRVMVDANVLISGMGWPRFAYEVLQHAVAGDYQLVLSEYVIEEARTHITRVLPDVVAQFDVFLQVSAFESCPSPTVAEVTSAPQLSRDIKDIPVGLAAIKARVDCLVSSDRDLTDPDQLIHQYVKVILPGTFLGEVMNWTSEDLEAVRHRDWKDVNP